MNVQPKRNSLVPETVTTGPLTSVTSTFTLPPVYFSASSRNLSAPLPFGVSGATTWLNLMTIGACAAAGPANASASTAGNFVRAVPLALALVIIALPQAQCDGEGLMYAIGSGAITSGLGYAVWYSVLPHLRATTAAIVQLCVPVIASLGAVVLLNEALSPRLGLATVAVLGGIGLVIFKRGRN